MAKWAEMGSGARAAVLAAAAGGVALAGAILWPGQPEPPPAPEAAAPAATEPAAAPAEPAPAADAAQPAAEAVDPPAAEAAGTGAAPAEAMAAPVFDLVRVEPDGAALVAGQAPPGASVGLFVDGAEVARAEADAQGRFVAMFALGASAAPRLLTLAARLADGADLAGRDSVALAPIAPPAPEPAAPAVALTEATPEAAPEAAPESAAGGGAAPDAEAPQDQIAAAEPAQVAPSGPAAEAVAEAAAAPTALLLTEEGVEVVQGAGPAEGVRIDTITYAPDGAVRTAGRASAGAVVRLYLDNAPVADAAVAADGQWQVVLPEVEPGLYTLRADQLDPAGAVTARYETPFLREAPQALAASAPPSAPTSAPPPPAEPPPADAAPPQPPPVTITVQPGFTLWQIARENFGEGMLYVQLFEANRDLIRDPDLIYPGQVFTVPALKP